MGQIICHSTSTKTQDNNICVIADKFDCFEPRYNLQRVGEEMRIQTIEECLLAIGFPESLISNVFLEFAIFSFDLPLLIFDVDGNLESVERIFVAADDEFGGNIFRLNGNGWRWTIINSDTEISKCPKQLIWNGIGKNWPGWTVADWVKDHSKLAIQRLKMHYEYCERCGKRHEIWNKKQ